MISPTAPAGIAAILTALVDVLIPGDANFPPASSVGTQGLLSHRIRQRFGHPAFTGIASALQGESFLSASVDERVAAVRRFERDQPELFAFVRFATYFSYYESPAVIATLQMLGHEYNDAPQPAGYAMPPFDPAKHLPASSRGTYKATDEIARLDLSPISDLGLPKREG